MEDKALELIKLTFDLVEPGRIRWRPNKDNLVHSGPSSHFGTMMRREVVQDDIDPFFDRILGTKPLESPECV